MRHRLRQLRVRDPKRFLSSLLRSPAHCHARSLRTTTVDYVIIIFSGIQTLTTDC
jgi:hypothetical protein